MIFINKINFVFSPFSPNQAVWTSPNKNDKTGLCMEVGGVSVDSDSQL